MAEGIPAVDRGYQSGETTSSILVGSVVCDEDASPDAEHVCVNCDDSIIREYRPPEHDHATGYVTYLTIGHLMCLGYEGRRHESCEEGSHAENQLNSISVFYIG